MQAITYNNLGISYIKIKNRPKENIEASINGLMKAKKLASKDYQPETFYRIINNLGLANIQINHPEEAIKYFTLSQEFFKEDVFPVQYGLIQETIGNILSNMQRAPDEGNLIEAIKCYENALRVINQDNRPLNFAQINSNLGLIYSSLEYNKGPDNLKNAESFYENALKVFTKDLYPHQYASIKNNLGNILVELSMLNGADSLKNTSNLLESAVKYFNEAIGIYKILDNKRESVMTKVNLANAYTHMPQAKKTNLNKAISIYQSLLSSPENKDYYDILRHNIETAQKTLQNLENRSK
jgi:tetratricopeptide (TPR) repeat protein